MSDTPNGRVKLTGDAIGTISPYIYGGMIEHFGRTVYGGAWDSENDVPRADVKAAVKAMGTTALRYPGGGFSATYHWKDGIGPKSERPTHESSFWSEMGENWHKLQSKQDPRYVEDAKELGRIIGPPETNLMGTDEFLDYCLDVDAEPVLVLNVNDGTVEEAVEWLRYCNIDRKAPRTVTWWAISNEAWNRFQPPHYTPEDYAKTVIEYATALREVDPSVKIVATGQPVSATEDEPQGNATMGTPDTSGGMPHVHYASREWDKVVLEIAGDHIDVLDVHWYFPGMSGQPLQGPGDVLQTVTAPDLLKDALAETARFADSILGDKKIELQIGEWNRMVQFEDHLEISHTLADAAFFAGCYNAFLANADRVTMCIISHLITTLAPIQANDGKLYVTSSYLVHQLYERFGRGTSISVDVESPTLDVPALELEGGFVAPAARKPRTAAQLSSVATRENGKTAVFLCNRSQEEAISVDVEGLDGDSARGRWITGPSLDAANTADHPDVLKFREGRLPIENGVANVTLPAGAVAVLVAGE
jgi:alpha-L-arabinofuranosidase